MNITGQNNGSLREIMDNTLQDLRNAEENNYLTAKVKGTVKVVDANKRGFVVALDYSTNASGGYMNPAGGNLVTTNKPELDRMTANYQYVQFGQEIDNENLANSKAGHHVGASAKAMATAKEMNRRLEFEEWYFCRGDGSQVLADITAAVVIAAGATGVIACSGARDGAGAWMVRVGQVVRVYDVTLATLKTVGTVVAKTSNQSFSLLCVSAVNIVDTDVILPQGDANAPTTTGIKGLPYLVKASGPYFDKTLSNVPALQAIVDSATGTITRTSMEQLYRRHNSIRNNKSGKTTAVVSPARMSDYFTQFYAQNAAQVHVVGGERPNVDNGAANREYTHFGQPIDEYKFLHPKFWYNLDFKSFCRLTLKEAGAMLTPGGDYVQKIQGGNYANAQQKWSDDFLEYLSVNPAKNSAFTALGFAGLPLLANDPFVG
ncbi:MAG TPA: hypothetical protein VNI84_18975 [Pyrinomonadaceae bacterium]|nr:hypothetical protein [Pyrinomonadaceae bacterium]